MPMEDADARPAGSARSGGYLYYRHALAVRIENWSVA
jgi:hypothetical protein